MSDQPLRYRRAEDCPDAATLHAPTPSGYLAWCRWVDRMALTNVQSHIAAEQLGRRCYGMEISPAYCAVILERWAKATGKTPAIESSAKPTAKRTKAR